MYRRSPALFLKIFCLGGQLGLFRALLSCQLGRGEAAGDGWRPLSRSFVTGGWDDRDSPHSRCQVGHDRPMEVDGDLRSLLVAQLLELGLEDTEALQHLRATGCVTMPSCPLCQCGVCLWGLLGLQARFIRQKRRCRTWSASIGPRQLSRRPQKAREESGPGVSVAPNRALSHSTESVQDGRPCGAIPSAIRRPGKP